MRLPFVRTLAGSVAPTPPTTDPNFENVTLLLHGDGTNGGQNNTFVDGSANNFAITRNGNTTQGTFSPYGDNWSVAVNGSSAYLTSANNANLAIGNSDFTFECWAYGNSFSTDWSTFLARWQSSGNYGYFFAYDTDGGLTFVYSTTGSAAGNVARVYGGTMTVGRWHHVAICRSAGTTRAFINGVQVGASTSDNVTIYNNNGPQTIGGVIDGTTLYHPFSGYISNLRLVIGTALYTSNFTPSSTPLTAVTNTKLLACASNRFVDKSPTGLTLTPTGSPSVQRFSPFHPTAAYAAGTIGGSGYFSAATQYLACGSNAAFAFGTGDFTIECWYYPTTTATTNQYAYVTDSVGGVCFGFESGAFLLARRSQSPYDLSYAYNIVPFQWLHLVAVRSGTTASLFLNGTRVATGTVTTNYSVTGPVKIGGFGFGFGAVGYLCDARSIKGTAAYDPTQTTLTVPTAPLTAITNTSLLLNFTNAAILDNAMMAVPETVGNAQISTSVKKYGTGSLYFDGTGDYLTAPNNAAFQFGTGNVTIESWIYISGNSAANPDGYRFASICSGIGATSISNDFWWVVKGNTTTTGTGVQLRVWNSGVGANVIDLNFTISQNTWHHIAFVRSGNTAEVFFNGTSQGTSSFSGTITAGTNPLLIGYSQTGTSSNYNHALNGYIDDLRITKGVARYTANFTPPTAALPDL